MLCIPNDVYGAKADEEKEKEKKRTNEMQKIYKFIDCVCMRAVLKWMERKRKCERERERWNEMCDFYLFHVCYLYLSAFEYRSMRERTWKMCICEYWEKRMCSCAVWLFVAKRRWKYQQHPTAEAAAAATTTAAHIQIQSAYLVLTRSHTQEREDEKK